MAVSKTGNAFVWGSNIRGQLGYDPKVLKSLPIPTKICLMLKDLKDEEAKMEMSEEVRQAIEEEEKQIPQDVEEMKKPDVLDLVSHAICGTWSSIFITETSKTRLHVWGGEHNIINSTFVLYNNMDDSNRIGSIKSRGDNVYYMNKTGELYSFSIENKKAILLEMLDKYRDLSLGSNFLGIVHQDNTLHMKGNNKNGQLGTGDTINRDEFTQITTMEPTRVSGVICGFSNTVILGKSFLILKVNIHS
jgi:hypothetical protein